MAALARDGARGLDILLVDTWLYRFLHEHRPLRGVKAPVASFHQLCYWEGMGSPLARWRQRRRMARALDGARHHIGVSRHVLRLDGVGRGSTAVIPPGRDLAAPVAPSRAKPRGELRVVSIGNYTSRRGHHVLVEALGAMPARDRSGITLRIIGNRDFDPGYAASLEALVARHGLQGMVVLDGWKSREEVGRILLESDALAFASQGEGYGMVVAEALLHRLPVVLSPLGVVKELVGGQACGRADGRHAHWLRAWRDLGEEEFAALREEARALGRRLARPWDEVVDRFEEALGAWAR